MKKRFKAILAVAVAGLGIVSLGAVSAQATSNSENYIKANEGTVSSSEQSIQHSMLLAGTNVTSSDNVDGILMAAGSNVTLKGKDTYGLAAGATVEIDGTIEKDLFAAGSIVNVNKDAQLGRDVYLAGSAVNVKSNVKGNTFVAAGVANFDGVTINGDLKIYAPEIVFNDKVTVNGTLQYNKDAKVSGLDKVTATQTDAYESTFDPSSMMPFGMGFNLAPTYGDYVMLMLIGAIGLMITAMVIAAIFPGIYRKLLAFFDKMKSGPVIKNIVFGICGFIALPILSIIVMLTIVGLPLGIIALIFYAFCAYMAFALAGVFIGHLILTKLIKAKANVYLEILIGVTIVALLMIVPMFGWLFGLAALFLGLGLVVELISRRGAKK